MRSTYRQHFENIGTTFNRHLHNIPTVFRQHSENIPKAFRQYSDNISTIFRQYFGSIAQHNEIMTRSYEIHENMDFNLFIMINNYKIIYAFESINS